MITHEIRVLFVFLNLDLLILGLMKLELALVEAFLGGIPEAVTRIYSGQRGFLWTTPRIQSNQRQEL